MTTIKFSRQDGEARLEWVPEDTYPDGGCVSVQLAERMYPGLKYLGPDISGAFAQGLERCGVSDPSPILLAAEKLRNERRTLAEDGSEVRSPEGRYMVIFSDPTFTGLSRRYSDIPTGGGAVDWDDIKGSWWEDAALAYHRAAYLPLLKADEAYPEGELPRKMTDDEVRFPDGSAGRMTMDPGMGAGPFIRFEDSKGSWKHSWKPTDPPPLSPEHPAHNPSQLARLRAFWDANQPKEAELNLRWYPDGKGVWFGSRGWFSGLWDIAFKDLPPSQRATVEAFFAKGPPVELAEDAGGGTCAPRVHHCNSVGRASTGHPATQRHAGARRRRKAGGEVIARKVHWSRVTSRRTLCGLLAHDVLVSDEPDDVTCCSCLRVDQATEARYASLVPAKAGRK